MMATRDELTPNEFEWQGLFERRLACDCENGAASFRPYPRPLGGEGGAQAPGEGVPPAILETAVTVLLGASFG